MPTVRAKLSLTSAVVAVAVAMLATNPAAAATKIQKEYLPSNDIYGFCDVEPVVPGAVEEPTWGFNAGAACIPLDGTYDEIKIKSIADATSGPIDYTWYFYDANWEEVGTTALADDPEAWLLESGENHAFGCDFPDDNKDATQWLEIPDDAAMFYVFLHGPLIGAGFGAAGLGECGDATPMATAGTITFLLR